MSYCYEYPRPAVTVDGVVFGIDLEGDDRVDAGGLKVLLIQRQLEPFQHGWALPGGFVRPQESLDDAAERELREETGLCKVFLEQLFSFGAPERDPRGRVITVAYYALVNLLDHKVQASTDAENAGWFSIDQLPSLAFDHAEIVALARERLSGKVRYAPVGFELLPSSFTLTQLQRLYEIVLERELDKRNFRKKVLGMELLKETGQVEKNVAHRAARLYRFDRRKYKKLTLQGFNFAI